MIDITRRNAVKIMGATIAAVPLYPVEASEVEKASTSLKDWAEQIAAEVSDFERLKAPPLLKGIHDEIFHRRQSTMAVEQVAHMRIPSLRNDGFDDVPGQRFVFSFEPNERGVFFHVVRDDDARNAINGGKVVRMKDLNSALVAVARTHQQIREIDAASLFNKARTYDASVGGDGVSVCSTNHPCATGVWANTFATQQDLNPQSLAAALRHIRGKAVDDRGLRIMLDGRKLLAPPALLSDAEAALAGLDQKEFLGMSVVPVVWDYLTNERAWFVLTGVNFGLMWFERMPFSLECQVDWVTDSVIVHSYERRVFGCADPRAVFGAFPT